MFKKSLDLKDLFFLFLYVKIEKSEFKMSGFVQFYMVDRGIER